MAFNIWPLRSLTRLTGFQWARERYNYQQLLLLSAIYTCTLHCFAFFLPVGGCISFSSLFFMPLNKGRVLMPHSFFNIYFIDYFAFTTYSSCEIWGFGLDQLFCCMGLLMLRSSLKPQVCLCALPVCLVLGVTGVICSSSTSRCGPSGSYDRTNRVRGRWKQPGMTHLGVLHSHHGVVSLANLFCWTCK